MTSIHTSPVSELKKLVLLCQTEFTPTIVAERDNWIGYATRTFKLSENFFSSREHMYYTLQFLIFISLLRLTLHGRENAVKWIFYVLRYHNVSITFKDLFFFAGPLVEEQKVFPSVVNQTICCIEADFESSSFTTDTSLKK